MNVIDLFSGAGGLTEGFVREGFKVVAHVEKEKWACETLKTRIMFHYLKGRNDLPTYFDYLRNSRDCLKIDEERRIILDKYPELEERVNIEVINEFFGSPKYEDGAYSTKSMIKRIERSLNYNNTEAVDLILGGPPCQAYSFIGRGRMKDAVNNDHRNYLFRYYRDIVNYFRPKIFVFENVPGIFTAKGGGIFTSIKGSFNRIGYTILSGNEEEQALNILDAKDFGVCQSRKRVILIGYNKDYFGSGIQYPEFEKYAITFNDGLNTRNALSDLPPLQSGVGLDYWFGDYPTDINGVSEYQKLLRTDSPGILHHKARPNIERDKHIYRLAIEMAAEARQLKYWQIPKRYRTHKNEESFDDRFKVHWWESIPHTIVAHMAKDGHYNIHPDIEQCRSLTAREAARIQSFPDNFKFEGPRSWQYVQIGNAVPPILAQTIARAIKGEILEN